MSAPLSHTMTKQGIEAYFSRTKHERYVQERACCSGHHACDIYIKKQNTDRFMQIFCIDARQARQAVEAGMAKHCAPKPWDGSCAHRCQGKKTWARTPSTSDKAHGGMDKVITEHHVRRGPRNAGSTLIKFHYNLEKVIVSNGKMILVDNALTQVEAELPTSGEPFLEKSKKMAHQMDLSEKRVDCESPRRESRAGNAGASQLRRFF